MVKIQGFKPIARIGEVPDSVASRMHIMPKNPKASFQKETLRFTEELPGGGTKKTTVQPNDVVVIEETHPGGDTVKRVMYPNGDSVETRTRMIGGRKVTVSAPKDLPKMKPVK